MACSVKEAQIRHMAAGDVMALTKGLALPDFRS